jgi:predicted dienelactone hydrolase
MFHAGRAAAGAPAASGRHPLILLSHGTGGAALQMMWLGQALAAHGYVVVAINHHGNTFAEGNPLPQGFVLWWERARDLTVLLDRVLADADLGPRIDPRRIGAAGFSIGGYTVAALAGARTDRKLFDAFCAGPKRDATCDDQAEMPDASKRFAALQKDPAVAASLAREGADYRDARIRAVVAIAPAVTHAFTPESLRAIRVPLLVIGGDADRTAPVATNAAHLAESVPGASLVRMAAGHYTFLAECTPAGRGRLGDLCADPPGADRAAAHRDAGDRAVAFFNRTLQ